jgi:TRAP-type C4-dicarboxylate transport system permease small subunit
MSDHRYVCACFFFFFLNLGKVGFMLTNLNWSGWMLATDMISPT